MSGRPIFQQIAKEELDWRHTMVTTEHYDIVVLGSGEAGKYLAWHMSATGKRTLMIERRYIGGSCPTIACLPSKNVIHSAKVASYARHFAEFGVSAGTPSTDMAAVRARKRTMVETLRNIHLANFEKNGTEIAAGEGRFVGERTIEVSFPDGTVRRVQGDSVIVSTGSRAKLEGIPGLAEARPLTHVEVLELDTVPAHLIVLGGGYISLEFAQAMRRFGSRVTVVEQNSRILHHEDTDVSDAIQKLFSDEGIGVITGARADSVTGKSGDVVTLSFEKQGEMASLEGSHLLVATGRTPNTSGIGLDLAGIETTHGGFIKVNERLETTASRTWAVGDCAGSPFFTHIAFDDFRVVRDNYEGKARVTTGRQVPFCLFIDPELARVGLTEAEAKVQGTSYRLAKIPMTSVLRTHTLSETRGFLKALLSTTDDSILGFTGFGPEVGELLAPVQLAMANNLPFTSLRDLIITHPTMTEGLGPLFNSKFQTVVESPSAQPFRQIPLARLSDR
jgi:pyruvate/2-oxoglutarate dehydrogenase complex dihydrolipoamide dehydrogenase (E3) component